MVRVWRLMMDIHHVDDEHNEGMGYGLIKVVRVHQVLG